MKREILFKAKRSEDGEWLEGQLTAQDGRCFITDDCIIDVVNFDSSTEFEYECEVIPETVCQYTGLKDKNGEKIFEGDEIAVMIGANRVNSDFVEFNNGSFVWEFEHLIELLDDNEYDMVLTGKNIHDK